MPKEKVEGKGKLLSPFIRVNQITASAVQSPASAVLSSKCLLGKSKRDGRAYHEFQPPANV